MERVVVNVGDITHYQHFLLPSVLLYLWMLLPWSKLAMPFYLGSDIETYPPFYFDQTIHLLLPDFPKFRLLAIGPSKWAVVIRIITRSVTWPIYFISAQGRQSLWTAEVLVNCSWNVLVRPEFTPSERGAYAMCPSRTGGPLLFFHVCAWRVPRPCLGDLCFENISVFGPCLLRYG